MAKFVKVLDGRKRPVRGLWRTPIISERLGLENREWSLALEAVPEVVLDRMMPAWG